MVARGGFERRNCGNIWGYGECADFRARRMMQYKDIDIGNVVEICGQNRKLGTTLPGNNPMDACKKSHVTD